MPAEIVTKDDLLDYVAKDDLREALAPYATRDEMREMIEQNIERAKYEILSAVRRDMILLYLGGTAIYGTITVGALAAVA